MASYNGIAEEDVLRAMDDVKRAYNVDEDRVYLTGLSMGGGGTWHLGLRYPDRFAAIAPVCAVGDVSPLRLHAGRRATKTAPSSTSPVPPPSPRTRRTSRSSSSTATPTPRWWPSTRGAWRTRYRDLGWLDKTVFYFEQPGVHHFAWDFAYRDASLFARLAPVKRNPSPDRVVYSTFSPRYNKAYWLRIDRIDRGFEHGPHRGDRGSDGRLRREDRQPLGLHPAA